MNVAAAPRPKVELDAATAFGILNENLERGHENVAEDLWAGEAINK